LPNRSASTKKALVHQAPSRELEPVLERFKPKMDPISLVYPQTRHLSPRVRAFIDFMVSGFG
jgi:DNA-binding transcriptional LysR family regulator